jgi:23S rRNA pseudouridine1911/1915/1917 synthase
MRFYFPVPETPHAPAGAEDFAGVDHTPGGEREPNGGQGVLVRNFLRQCAVSTELARAVKFHGGGFYADGQPILANRRIFAGQVLSFDLPPDEAGGVEPQPEIPVRVVYEDEFAIVLDKPAHLAVHPTLNYPRNTLANGYAALMAARGESPVFRPVNRIDKDTSGLVLAAKNAYAAPLLAGGVEKLYIAIAEGELPLGLGVIDAPIGRREGSIIGRCVTPAGKPSRTEYTVECAADGLSLAACVPVTGRTHQIRVHFASIGHPLAGDDLYGGSRARIGRQALHCARQTFCVPEGQACEGGFRFAMPLRMREITVESPLPPDMAALARLAGKK